MPVQNVEQPQGIPRKDDLTNQGNEAQPQYNLQMPDEFIYYIQQAKEEGKFEVKQELTQALNAKAQQLSDIDPVVATALQAVAAAINESVSSVTPLGENEQFNAQQESNMPDPQRMMSSIAGKNGLNNQSTQAKPQPSGPGQNQAKTASEYSLEEVTYETCMSKIASTDYFEQDISEEQRNADLMRTLEIIALGINKFAEAEDVDFTDPQTKELLICRINDGTFYHLGMEDTF